MVTKSKIKGNFSGHHTVNHGVSTSVKELHELYYDFYTGLVEKEKKRLNELYTHVEFDVNVTPK